MRTYSMFPYNKLPHQRTFHQVYQPLVQNTCVVLAADPGGRNFFVNRIYPNNQKRNENLYIGYVFSIKCSHYLILRMIEIQINTSIVSKPE